MDNAPLPAPPRTEGGEPGAAVVIPVYRAAAELDRCLEVLADTTDLLRHPLTLVFDGPQPDAVEEVVAARLAALGAASVLRSEAHRGFPATANRGLAAAPGRDVVLLNSDVEPTAGWLDRLAAAARSRPRVASVTPLTNHGTIASVPRWLEENALPAGQSLATFAALVERVSARRYPTVPTGVGFCIYLRREALDEVGVFDQATFGPGYGEEVDWCLRAAAVGFEHLVDDATYVFHRGASSFGPGSGRQVRRAQRTLERRHPGYTRRVAAFIRADPLRPVLQRVREALQPAREPGADGAALRLVHVAHGWPPWNYAGAESYAARLVRGQTARHRVTVYARYAPADRARGSALELVDSGARVRLIANDFLQRDPLSRNALHDRHLVEDFGRLLDEERPDIIHVHHLAGHCLTLTRAAEQRGIPVLWQLQDWWTMCRRANLLDRDRELCAGPSPIRCSRCLPATGLPPAALWGPLLYGMRITLARQALASASAVAAGSAGVVEDHRRLELLPPGVPVRIFDYGVPDAPRAAPLPRAPGAPLRLGFIGTLAPHKGLHLAAAALAGLPPERIRLDVWGEPREGAYADEVRLLARGAAIRFHAPYAETELAGVLAGLDLLLAPSLGLESYGLAVAEAMAAGVPVLASGRGALAERLAAGGGALFDPERPETLRALLVRALDEPAQLAAWRRGIPPQISFSRHALEIESLYREVLERERRRK